MSGELVYQTWEIGAQDLPPQILVQTVQPQEQLLWAAAVPISRRQKQWAWLVLLCIPATFLFAQIAPWGQSMAEDCAGDDSPSCRKLYLSLWPGVIALAYASGFGIWMSWKARTSPWLNYFGITTDHAIIINGNRPGKVHRKKLVRNSARIDWFGAVRFGQTRDGSVNDLATGASTATKAGLANIAKADALFAMIRDLQGKPA